MAFSQQNAAKTLTRAHTITHAHTPTNIFTQTRTHTHKHIHIHKQSLYTYTKRFYFSSVHKPIDFFRSFIQNAIRSNCQRYLLSSRVNHTMKHFINKRVSREIRFKTEHDRVKENKITIDFFERNKTLPHCSGIEQNIRQWQV